MKYRVWITHESVVEADTKAEAEAAAFQASDEGQGIFTVEVEPLLREVGEDAEV